MTRRTKSIRKLQIVSNTRIPLQCRGILAFCAEIHRSISHFLPFISFSINDIIKSQKTNSIGRENKMTAYERVLASRLIEKIENNRDYAKQIGLSYTLSAGKDKKDSQGIIVKDNLKNQRRVK